MATVTVMRVLVLAWEFPPESVGGAAAHVDGFARALGQTGHDVVVLTRGRAGLADDERAGNVRVLRARVDLPWMPDEFIVGQAASGCHHLIQLTASFDGWTPDVVHAHNWQVGWAGHTLAVLYGVPLVTTFHSTLSSQHGGRVPPGTAASIHAAESWLAHSSTQVVASSKFMAREIIIGLELPAERVHRVPNGIDPTWWEGGEHAERRSPSVLTWGRVQYEKGFQELARAMRIVRRRVPEATCLIAGRGSYLPELQSQIDIEGVSDIVSLGGFLSDERLRDALHRAGCVVIPSLYEPFGIVALEALAGGAPLIVARTGGLAELIEGSGAGLMFEPGNTEDLARCVELVLTDSDQAAHMSGRGAELLRARYSWNAIAAATVDIYRGATPDATEAALTPE